MVQQKAAPKSGFAMIVQLTISGANGHRDILHGTRRDTPRGIRHGNHRPSAQEAPSDHGSTPNGY